MLWGSGCESIRGSRKEDGSETGSSGCGWGLWSCSGRLSLEYSVYHSWRIKVWNRIREWSTKESLIDCADFLTCISSSYIFMLRSVFVLDLRPWYTRDKCCTQHTPKWKTVMYRLHVKRAETWLCYLTPPLSMAWRTPCRELIEDSPGQICL